MENGCKLYCTKGLFVCNKIGNKIFEILSFVALFFDVCSFYGSLRTDGHDAINFECRNIILFYVFLYTYSSKYSLRKEENMGGVRFENSIEFMSDNL